jgi:HEAT repeat protein
MLNMPSSVVSLFIVAIQVGGAISLLAWGRVADAIGFRPMLRGLIVLTVLTMPLHLLVAPFGEGSFAWSQIELREMVTVLVLLIQGLIGGALASGKGIAVTSIQHYLVGDRESLEAINIWNLVVFAVTSAAAIFHGYFLQGVAMPRGVHPFFNGVFYFDCVKGFVFFVNLPVQLVVLWQLGKLTNTRPYFGITDFFSSLSSGFVRSSLARRYIYHEDEGRRANVARWFGDNLNPVNLDPLLRLLTDPSYDVKVSTIRSLARTGSPLAGQKLLEILDDESKRQLHDHVAWALGELRHAAALPALVAKLEPHCPSRIRAMAARALGKIGDRSAVAPLVGVLRDPTAREHEISSACRSLIRLKAIDYSEAIFDAFAAMDDRHERFELTDALCDTLEITNRWLLISDSESLQTSLLAYVDAQQPGWAEERAEVIEAVRGREATRIKELLRQAAGEGPYADSRRIHSLRRALEKTDRWQALTVVAAAWLLLRRG